MIAVVIAGGRVDGIVTDDPAQVGTEVLVIDYEIDADAPTVTVKRFGAEAQAFAFLERVTPAASLNLAGVCQAVLDGEAAAREAELRWLDQQQQPAE
jgi:fructose-specific component phosphotransferase system IIB-like protein